MQTSRLGLGAARRLGGLTCKLTGDRIGVSLYFQADKTPCSLLRTSIKRSFFNKLFGRGPSAREEEPAAQAPSIITERRKESSYEKDSYKKQTPMSEEEVKFLKKKEEFLQSLAKKRDAQDSELEKRRKEIKEASTASRREFEITLASLDYGKIIQDNIAINRETEFESVEDLISFIAKISNAKIKLTEENIVKVLHGYINYAPTLGKEAAQSREFAYLLNLLRSMIGALAQTVSEGLTRKASCRWWHFWTYTVSITQSFGSKSNSAF